MTKVPKLMTVIEIANPGQPDVLRPASRPVEAPSLGEVLIKVVAAGVNRADVLQRRGQYPPPPGASDIPGLEVSGTVVAVGGGVEGWHVGEKTCALVTGGGYAEYCLAPAVQCMPIPPRLDIQSAAAVPEAFFTVWTNLFDHGRLKTGDTLLVHGGSSGIGTTAISLAHTFGAEVFATAGSAEKCSACESLGAVRAINYRDDDFVEVLQRLKRYEGIDIILDIIGGSYLRRNLDVLTTGGRLVLIGLQGGAKAEIDLAMLMRKRLVVTGSTLRPMTIGQKAAIANSLRKNVWPLFSQKKISPIIHASFPLQEAAAAHQILEASTHIGKLILTV